MRITQGAFSFLPDLTDEQIEAQLALRARATAGRSWSSTPTTRTRATRCGSMWGRRCFDLASTRRRRACATCARPRGAPAPLREGRLPTTARSGARRRRCRFIVNRPGRRARLPAGAPGDGRPARALHAARLRRRRARPDERYGGAATDRQRSHRRTATSPRRARSMSRPMLDELDRELVGLGPVKTRIREIAALLVVDRLRARGRAELRRARRCTCASPATPAPARRPSRCGWRRSSTGSATSRRRAWSPSRATTSSASTSATPRPRPRRCSSARHGGVLFIDEAYYLYRPENERDYGQEAIEILLQVMEAERDELVVDPGRLQGPDGRRSSAPTPAWARASPTTSSSPTTTSTSCWQIAELMLDQRAYEFTRRRARGVRAPTSSAACERPRFANARSIRNAIDRARLRQAGRLFDAGGALIARGPRHDRGRGHPRAARVFATRPGPATLSPEAGACPGPIILGVVGDSAAGKTTLTRGLVRVLGENNVTHVARRRLPPLRPRAAGRARHHAAAPGLQLHRHHGAAPAPTCARGTPILKPVYQHKDGTFGPPVYVEPRSSRSSRGCSATTPTALRDLYDVRVFLAPPEELRRAVEGRSATARAAATRPTRCSRSSTAASPTRRPTSARSSAGPTSSSRSRPAASATRSGSTPSSSCARASRTPTSRRSSATTTAASRLERARRRARCASPATSTRRAARRSRRRLGRHALRQPPALRAARRVHDRHASCTAPSRWRSSRCSSSTTS